MGRATKGLICSSILGRDGEEGAKNAAQRNDRPPPLRPQTSQPHRGPSSPQCGGPVPASHYCHPVRVCPLPRLVTAPGSTLGPVCLLQARPVDMATAGLSSACFS